MLSFFRFLHKKYSDRSQVCNQATNLNKSTQNKILQVDSMPNHDNDEVIKGRLNEKRSVNDRLDNLESLVNQLLNEFKRIGGKTINE